MVALHNIYVNTEKQFITHFIWHLFACLNFEVEKTPKNKLGVQSEYFSNKIVKLHKPFRQINKLPAFLLG